jgi:hypothetical protein
MTAPPVPIENIDAFLGIVGQWNLYDMEIRGVSYRADRVGTGVLELSLYLHADNLRPRQAGAPAAEYEFVFRFDGAERLFMDDFAGAIVGEHEFASRTAPNGAAFIDVSLSSISAGDIRFLCTNITVLSVRELAVREQPG